MCGEFDDNDVEFFVHSRSGRQIVATDTTKVDDDYCTVRCTSDDTVY